MKKSLSIPLENLSLFSFLEINVKVVFKRVNHSILRSYRFVKRWPTCLDSHGGLLVSNDKLQKPITKKILCDMPTRQQQGVPKTKKR